MVVCAEGYTIEATNKELAALIEKLETLYNLSEDNVSNERK